MADSLFCNPTCLFANENENVCEFSSFFFFFLS